MSNKAKNVLGKILTFIIIIILIILYAWVNSTNNTNFRLVYDSIVIDETKLNIFYFYVGQADCTLITLGNENMLIDTGNEEDANYILNFLKEKEITHIKYLVGTHIHEDHIGGMDLIIADKDITIDNIFIPGTEYGINNEYDEIKDEADKRNYTISIVNEGDIKELGNAKIEVLSVDNNYPRDLNDSSIVIQLDYLQTKYLFMGDATSSIEKSIINLENIDVLKVGHHGSNGSTTKEFLEKIKPKYAVISSGKNDTKHPGAETVKRLENIGIYTKRQNLFITEEVGTVWIASDGNNISITSTWDINLDSVDNKNKQTAFVKSFLIYVGTKKEDINIS